MRPFTDLRDAFYAAHMAAEPEDATLLGAPGRDHILRDPSLAGDEALRARCRELLARLARLDPHAALSPREQAERWSLQTYAEHHARALTRPHLEPLLLPYTALQHQLARAADLAAWDALAGRLSQIPRFLADALLALAHRAPVLDRVLAAHFARDLLPDAATFLHDELPGLAPADLPPPLRTRLRDLAAAAAAAYLACAEALTARPADDRFALGDDEVAWRLAHHYGLGPAEDLLEIASDELRAAQADRIDAADRWSRAAGGPQVRDLAAAAAAFRVVAARRLGRADEAIPLYRDVTARALALIRERDLFDLPDPLDLAFLPTPPAIRRVVGQATNWPAPLLRPGPAGFTVTLDPAVHSIAGAANLAVHEGIPGHGLQSLTWQRRHGASDSPVAFLGLADDLAAARDFWAPHLNIEGWAVRCEHVMHDAGLLRPDEALFFHVARAIRALRVLLDVDLARGRLTRDDAAVRLSEGSAMPLAWCEGQVLRYTRIPLQASTYLLGHLAFADLERRCRAAWGPGFTLRRFHTWALAWPPVPPARIDPTLDP